MGYNEKTMPNGMARGGENVYRALAVSRAASCKSNRPVAEKLSRWFSVLIVGMEGNGVKMRGGGEGME